MAFKFVVLAAFVAVANAGVLPALHSAPLAYASAPAVVAKTIDADYDPHPQYSYSYDVKDSLTGDDKTHSETRDGDLVQGSYSLLESDGTRRIVTYTADPVNGFQAIVDKQPAAVAVKAIAAAPVSYAPVAPIAPVAKIAAHYPYVAQAPLPAVAKIAYHAAPAAYAAPSGYVAPAIAAPSAYAAAPAFAAPAFAHAKIAYSAQPAYNTYIH